MSDTSELEDEFIIVPMRITLCLNGDDTSKAVSLSSRRLLPSFFDYMFRNSAIHAGRVKVFIYLRKVSESIQIEIVDHGISIPLDIHDGIFQRGVSTEGEGMGLYLCKRIIEGYGDTLELLKSSLLGKSATFRALFPIKELSHVD